MSFFLKNKRFIVLVLFLNITLAFAQNNFYIKGKIVDITNKQPIAFANISLIGTNIGTVSDIDGNFSLKCTSLPVNIQISFVGYENKIVTLQNSSDNLVIYMKPKTIDLPELTVKASENPVHRIVRKVIENRERNNPEQLSSFSYVSYNKLIFTIDKKSVFYQLDTIRIKAPQAIRYEKYNPNNDSVYSESNFSHRVDSFFSKHYLFLSESITRRVFKYPDNNKEWILATRTSGIQQPYFVVMATQFQSFSFYSDYVNVFGKKYLNPLSEQAIGRYFYEIKDTVFSEEGDSVFVIFFRPLKNTLFDGLKGIMQVNTKYYAIQTIQAEPAKQESAMMVCIQQLYRQIDHRQWFPYQLNTEIKMKGFQIKDKNDTLLLNDTLAVVVSKTIPLLGVGKSYIDSVELNPPLNKKIFDNIQVELKKNAHKVSDSIWMKYRAESFGEKEKNTYRFIDSLGKEAKLDNKIRFFEIMLNGYISISFINLSIKNLFAYNRFEGYRINADIITNEKLSKYWAVGGYVGYGFHDKALKNGGIIQFTPWPLTDTKLRIEYKDDVREAGEISFFDNKAVSGGDAYRQLYIWNMDYVRQYSVNFTFRLMSYFKNRLQYSRNYFELNSLNRWVLNDTTFNALDFEEYTFSTKFLYKEQFFQTFNRRFSLGSKYPSFWFNVHLGSFFTTSKKYLKMESKLSIPITWGLYGKTTFTVMGGYTPNQLPISLLYGGYSSYDKGLPLSANQTFATMRMGEFYFDRFVFVFLKHDFGNILFHIGKFNPGLSLHHNMAWGDLLSVNSYNSINTTRNLFLESGIEVYNLFKQFFNGLGLGVYYRYGYYALPTIKDNLAFKLVFTKQVN
ncbi:MAG: DUF5686 family protein [Bacteroidales bacterium]